MAAPEVIASAVRPLASAGGQTPTRTGNATTGKRPHSPAGGRRTRRGRTAWGLLLIGLGGTAPEAMSGQQMDALCRNLGAGGAAKPYTCTVSPRIDRDFRYGFVGPPASQCLDYSCTWPDWIFPFAREEEAVSAKKEQLEKHWKRQGATLCGPIDAVRIDDWHHVSHDGFNYNTHLESARRTWRKQSNKAKYINKINKNMIILHYLERSLTNFLETRLRHLHEGKMVVRPMPMKT